MWDIRIGRDHAQSALETSFQHLEVLNQTSLSGKQKLKWNILK